MSKTLSTLIMLRLAAMIARQNPTLNAQTIADNVLLLQRIAKVLRQRYENGCNYAWANTDKYYKSTEKKESRALAIADTLGIKIQFQGDPRGASLEVKLNDGASIWLG